MPKLCLNVQISGVRERNAWPQTLLAEADAPLDFAFGLWR
jgi:hypothetical protein